MITIEELIQQGESFIITSHKVLRRNTITGENRAYKNRYEVDKPEEYLQWVEDVRLFVKQYFPNDFSEFNRLLGFVASTGNIIAKLNALKKSQLYITKSNNVEKNAIYLLGVLCDRFHLVARQIRQRYNNRETLDIKDEYDTQDLLHSLLRIYFDDIRKEEWNPSYAGGATRSDFLLKNEQIIIEVKKTRTGLNSKKLGEELIIDIVKYKTHHNCKYLYCFVYDPEGYIDNPRGIENDLSGEKDGVEITVKIIPKH